VDFIAPLMSHNPWGRHQAILLSNVFAQAEALMKGRSTAEARKELAACLPDLVLLDVIMPGEDGLAFAKELAQKKDLDGIPVVLVTAVADGIGRMLYAFEKDEALTADDVLPKNQLDEKLLTCVASALENSKRAS
jgi:CheY-like chemotaxis protein